MFRHPSGSGPTTMPSSYGKIKAVANDSVEWRV